MSYLSGQLLLAVYQALDVCGVVSTALTGRDGALKGGGGHLGGDAGGGAEGAAAQTGRQGAAQGFRRRRLTQFLTEQQQVTCLLHLTRTEMDIKVWRSPRPVRYSYAGQHKECGTIQSRSFVYCPHLMQLLEFLQLPLVLQDQTVSSGSPTGQVLLSTHIRHRCIQHLPSPSLHT